MKAAIVLAIGLAACSGSPEPGPSEMPVASVSIAPDSLTVLMLGYGGLTAVLEDPRGHVLTGRDVVWTSASPAVAMVDANGTVRGLTLGTAGIIATSDNGRADTVVVRVIPKVVLSPRLPSLFPGDTTQLTAAVLTATGSSAGSVPVTWSSTTAATVSNAGIVLGGTPGVARVTATAAGGVASIDVTVLKRPGTLTRKVAWTTSWLEGEVQYGEVWVADADGGNAVRVSPPNSNPGPAAWSPNGDRLAFTLWPVVPTSPAAIVVVSPSGTLLSTAPGYYGNGLAWSPDGTKILYDPDGSALWIWRLGSAPQVLLYGLGSWVTGQSWSPDGHLIAFGRLDCTGATVMDADGGNQVALPGDACAPDFSPDGKMLAYNTHAFSLSGVFVMSRASGTIRPASPNCMPGPACTGDDPHELIGWRSDGYSVDERGSVFKSFDTRSGAISSLGTRPSELWVLGWSPDGSKVLYFGDDNGHYRIGIMNADFSGRHFISSPTQHSTSASWQPAP